jgi:hypothetical protein
VIIGLTSNKDKSEMQMHILVIRCSYVMIRHSEQEQLIKRDMEQSLQAGIIVCHSPVIFYPLSVGMLYIVFTLYRAAI